jgi:hypothetical protein
MVRGWGYGEGGSDGEGGDGERVVMVRGWR